MQMSEDFAILANNDKVGGHSHVRHQVGRWRSGSIFDPETQPNRFTGAETRSIQPSHSHSIIELGCWPGDTLVKEQGRGGRVVALGKAGVNFRQNNFANLSFGEAGGMNNVGKYWIMS